MGINIFEDLPEQVSLVIKKFVIIFDFNPMFFHYNNGILYYGEIKIPKYLYDKKSLIAKKWHENKIKKSEVQ